MILIGQYDSSFVRRIGIALRLYGIPFEHRPWSTFGDADKIRPFNPLMRVPTLILDNGDGLIESHLIIDYIDSLVPQDKRMFPAAEPHRHRALKIAALATGVADKAVALFYELHLHSQMSSAWVERCKRQIAQTLDDLEGARVAVATPYWFGDEIGHADIAVAAALRHACEAHPQLITLVGHPALAAHCARLEALPVFKEIAQEFVPPSNGRTAE